MSGRAAAEPLYFSRAKPARNLRAAKPRVNSTLHQSSHGFATRVHGFATKQKHSRTKSRQLRRLQFKFPPCQPYARRNLAAKNSRIRDAKKHKKTRFRDSLKTPPRFRDWNKIFRDPEFSGYHSPPLIYVEQKYK